MSHFEHKYFNTYYYSNIISNILSKDVSLIGFISNFFSDEEAIFSIAKPFQKHSAFHCFIAYMIHEFFENDMHEYDQAEFNNRKISNYPKQLLYAELALKEYGFTDFLLEDYITTKSKNEYSDIEAYHEELVLTGTLEELYDRIANEVFYLMFNNREALLQFNHIVSEHMKVDINEIEDNETRKLFTQQGYLKRVKIPTWCKKAVFFRDRGRCCFCTKDLSGILNINSGAQFDHIIPLAKFGLNDVSNIQLLCSDCNNKKNKHKIETSSYYESWY